MSVQQSGRTIGMTNALSDLVLTSRELQARAYKTGLVVMAMRLNSMALQFDAARTRLVQDGPEYLSTAHAFVDAGRVAIANYRLLIERRKYRPFGYRTLDCRDGQHMACDTCDCQCHFERESDQ